MPTSSKLQAVRKHFVMEQMPLTQAATLAGVAYGTARNWKRKALDGGDDWDIARSAVSLSNGGSAALSAHVLEDFIILFETTIGAIKKSDMSANDKVRAIARLSDSYVKTMRAAGMANPALNKLGVAMEVLGKLSDYIKKHHPELLPAFIEVLEPFGTEISKHFGSVQ